MEIIERKKMKIIVTGSEGLLGKEIVKHLEKKYDVIKLDKILGHDLDDDGYMDVIVTAEANKVVWYKNDGSQNFTENIIDDSFDICGLFNFLFFNLCIVIFFD